MLNGSSTIADPLDPSFGQEGLVGHIKQLILERRAADICDQNFHEIGLFAYE
jgi:hypothetical protein